MLLRHDPLGDLSLTRRHFATGFALKVASMMELKGGGHSSHVAPSVYKHGKKNGAPTKLSMGLEKNE